jgi:tetratricopeptide (TPR) repeat protein
MAELLDPLSLRPKVLTAWTLYQMRDFAASLEKANEIITLDPNFWQGYLQAANCLLEFGEVSKALENAHRASELGGPSALPTYVLCFALTATGKRAEAVSVANELVERSRSQYISPYFIGMSLLGAGEIDRAFEELEKAQHEHTPWMAWFGTEAKFDTVRGDERYWNILKASKNPIIDIIRK